MFVYSPYFQNNQQQLVADVEQKDILALGNICCIIRHDLRDGDTFCFHEKIDLE